MTAESARGIPGWRPCEVPAPGTVDLLSTLRPYVRQTGNDRRIPHWRIGSRRLLDYLAVFVVEGDGVFQVGEETFKVRDGDMAWIPPDTPHTLCGGPKPMRLLFAHFDLLYDPARSHWDACIPAGTLDLSAFRVWMHPPLPDPVIGAWRGRLRVPNAPAVEAAFRRLCLEHRRAPGDALLHGALLQELLAELLRGGGTTAARQPHEPAMRVARETIQTHPEAPLDLAALAAAARLSPSHFRRLFVAVHGESPRAMHRRARIRRACELLAYSNLNVSEIAQQLGFSTVHNLSRAFRALNGVPPTPYRKAPA